MQFRPLVPSPEYALLCNMVAERKPAVALPPDTEQLWRLARAHEVESIVGHRLIEIGTTENLDVWREAHAIWMQRISQFLEVLDLLAERLSRRGIKIVALKNGGIARGIHPCPGCCPMGDVDLLVDPASFEAAHIELVDFGFQLEFRSALEEEGWEAAERSGSAEYWMSLEGEPTRLWLELQSRAIAGTWIRPDQEPPTEDLMSRSIPIRGSKVCLLSPEDNLLQVAVHAAKHSYVRAPGFRLHTDVDRIVNGTEMDWDLFIERVEALRVRTAVYFALLIPQDIFGTAIPFWVTKRLQPSRLKQIVLWRMIRHAGLFDPGSKKFSRPAYIAFHVLLYDGIGALRSAFPSAAWMQRRYGPTPKAKLPYLYSKRLVGLIFRRYS